MPRLVALVPKEKHIARFAFRLISQIGIRYRKSSLSRDASHGSLPANAPRPGDRLPFLVFQEGSTTTNIHEKVKTPAFHLLLFSGNSPDTDRMTQAVRDVIHKYDDMVQDETIPLTSATKHLYTAFGIKDEGYYLVRPDMYVACRSSQIDAEYLKSYFMRILKT